MREMEFENPLSVFIFPSKQVRSQIPYLIQNNTTTHTILLCFLKEISMLVYVKRFYKNDIRKNVLYL